MLKYFDGESIKEVNKQINLQIQIDKEEHGECCHHDLAIDLKQQSIKEIK
jgi:hypothetical protein